MIRAIWRLIFPPRPAADLSMIGLRMRRLEVSAPKHADDVGPAPMCSRCGSMFTPRPVGSRLEDSTRCRSCDKKLSEVAASRKVLAFGGRKS